MSPVRGLGNLLIRTAFRLLIGRAAGDLLSGYRAFSRRFLQSVELGSEGFEIETELAIEAAARKLATLEVSVPYRPRIAGTESKLRAFRDGRRILGTILSHALRRNPARVILVYAAAVAALFIPLYRWTWLVALELLLLVLGPVLFAIAAVRAKRATT
jgi:hypothetical protein